ncbi:DUF968 domain-containing protein [Citrobacter braakii]|nr:DUF968 domain-containing protein [Citrobacter braakii]
MSRSKNKSEKLHLSRVAGLGCIVCKNLKLGETPADIHHIRTGQGVGQRADNFKVIPLCSIHHRQGGHGIAIHAGRQSWENNFGTETELLVQVLYELGDSA